MPTLNGIITPPLSVADVSSTLGVGSHDVGTLCSNSHGKISIWAKYKPVKVAKIFGITDDDREYVSYGVGNIPYFTRTADMNNFMLDASSEPVNGFQTYYFDYSPPKGGQQEPYRLADFSNYMHGATAPIGKLHDSELSLGSTNDLHPYFDLGPDSDLSIRINDLNIAQYIGSSAVDTDDWYMGVGFVNSTRSMIVTQTTKLSSLYHQGAVVHIPTFNPTWVGNYTIYAYISNIQTPEITTTALTSGYFIPLTMSKSTATVKTFLPDIVLTVTAAWKDVSVSNRLIYYTYSIRNNEGSNYTATGIKVEVLNATGVTIASALRPDRVVSGSTTFTESQSANVNTLSNFTNSIAVRVTASIAGLNLGDARNITNGPPQV